MRITEITYGRTIEVGRFGRGRSGRVWFGFTATLETGDTEVSVLAALQDRADAQEVVERDMFDRKADK